MKSIVVISYDYETVIVPTGIAAALQNLGSDDAYIFKYAKSCLDARYE